MKTEDIALKISGKQDICCAGCEVDTINATLENLPGISKVNANFENLQVKVNMDAELIPVAKIRESLEQIGWQSQEVSA